MTLAGRLVLQMRISRCSSHPPCRNVRHHPEAVHDQLHRPVGLRRPGLRPHLRRRRTSLIARRIRIPHCTARYLPPSESRIRAGLIGSRRGMCTPCFYRRGEIAPVAVSMCGPRDSRPLASASLRSRVVRWPASCARSPPRSFRDIPCQRGLHITCCDFSSGTRATATSTTGTAPAVSTSVTTSRRKRFT